VPTHPTAELPADVSIQMSRELHKRLKLLAVERGMILKQLVNMAVIEWLDGRVA
jgi:hypothetical protein